MRLAALAALALAGCHATPNAAGGSDAGARLERAAVTAGLVVDPAARSLTGSWANDTDRLCVVPGAGDANRLGVVIDYGGGLGCVGSGSATRRDGRLSVDLGENCRFDAAFDGERIVFPANMPGGCDRLCTGRATLSALRVERLSASPSEAASLRAPSGRSMCGS